MHGAITCPCRGVVWDEDSQKWAVCLSPTDGQPQKQLGLFYTEEAAASAYDQLALELWGPSTPTNFGCSGVCSSHLTKSASLKMCVNLT